MPRGRKKAEVTGMIEQVIPVEETKDNSGEIQKEKKASCRGKYQVNVSSYLNVRNGAGKDHKIVGRLDNGDVIICSGKKYTDSDGNEWMKIIGDSTGFCMMEYLTKV